MQLLIGNRQHRLTNTVEQRSLPSTVDSDPDRAGSFYFDADEFSAKDLDQSMSVQGESLLGPATELSNNSSLILNDVLSHVDASKICFCRSNSFSMQESKLVESGGFLDEDEAALPVKLNVSQQVPDKKMDQCIELEDNNYAPEITKRATPRRAAPMKRGIPQTKSEGASQSKRSLLQAMRSISTKALKGLDSEIKATPNPKDSKDQHDAKTKRALRSPPARRGVNRAKSEQKHRPGLTRGSLWESVRSISVKAIKGLESEAADDTSNTLSTHLGTDPCGSPTRRGVARTKSEQKPLQRPGLGRSSLSRRALWHAMKSASNRNMETGVNDHNQNDNNDESSKPVRKSMQNTSFRWTTIDCTGNMKPADDEVQSVTPAA